MLKIAFSWDDGAVEDLKLMDYSIKHSMPGMFFIPASNMERDVLHEPDIKEIAENGYEIGSHTFSHKYLTETGLAEAGEEMLKGRDYIEQLLGKEAPHFCYPGGKYNNNINILAKEYFTSARTADICAVVKDNEFLIRPAFHFFDRGRKSLLFNSIKNWSPVLGLLGSWISTKDYFRLITALIDRLADSAGEYKIIIWGHSWEIEENDLWGKLDDFFRHLNSNHAQCISRYSDLVNY